MATDGGVELGEGEPAPRDRDDAGCGDPGAIRLVQTLTAAGLTIATAESLTGGLVCARLVDVPGASAVVKGAVVAYAVSAKASVLGVPRGLIDDVGTVSDQVAAGMATGVRSLLGADIGVATTGVAGPDPAEGKPVGTVFIAVATAATVTVQQLALSGDRRAIREETVSAALSMVVSVALSVPAGTVGHNGT